MSTEKTNAQVNGPEEIQRLDAEAREALDRLADKREELARQHEATELAAEIQREREEEKRRKEEAEAEEREERRRREELDRLGRERLALEERVEKQAAGMIDTLQELLAFDRSHHQVLGSESFSVHNPPQDFPRELRAWFRGRFNEVLPGIGSDYRSPGYAQPGPTLAEREELTPKASPVGEDVR